MPYASDAGVNVYYEVHGEGPAILFAHGAGGHHAMWWQQVPHFRDRFSVITMDFPGFGLSQSDRDEYDSHGYPSSILAVLDHAEVEQAVLIGQSLGSPPSLSVGVRNPERIPGVIQTNSIVGVDDDQIVSMVQADRAEVEKIPVIDRLLRKSFQQEHPEMVFLFQQMGTFNKAKQQDLRNIWVPTVPVKEINAAIEAGLQLYFLGGDEDWVRQETYARVQEVLPGAHVDVVKGVPHSMYWEAPQLFNKIIDGYLEKIYGVRPAADQGR